VARWFIASSSLAAACNSHQETRIDTGPAGDLAALQPSPGANADATASSAPPPAASVDAPVVQTSSGAVRGVLSGKVEQFLGIPYAAPPTATLRFAPPAPPATWTGVRDASQPGPICVQPGALGIGGKEDCLSVNVYRPVNHDPSVRLPVMVWIHGGSFVIGAGSGYDPHRLVEANDMVVVTLNYRLGMLGFLALPALSSESPEGLSGDYGLMDQQAALRWVRDEIARFGGDPDHVTIAGQSAGGASVCAQLTSPPAAGLFSQAIIQSASCASVRLSAAEAQGTALAGALQCNDASQAASCLRSLPAEQLAAASLTGIFGPVVGGGFLPTAPQQVVAMGAPSHIPVLVGGVSDEMRGFDAAEYPLDPARYPSALAAHFPNIPTDAITALYPLDAYPEAYLALTATLSDSGAYLGGALGGCVTATLADDLSASTRTYAYELDDPNFVWAPGASPVPLPRGASHSSDLAYLFDPIGFVLSVPFDAKQTALADQMVHAWGAFIRGSDPNTATAPEWPPYDSALRRMIHLEPNAVKTVTDFRERHHCDFWQAPPGQPATRDAGR
jgi:para-nitrobenzyl esterase